jgi:hypothetical protein
MGAIQENVDVMCESSSTKVLGSRLWLLTNPSSNSQEERISILKHALVQKGIVSASHYDLNPSHSAQLAPATVDTEPNPPPTMEGESGDDGLHL